MDSPPEPICLHDPHIVDAALQDQRLQPPPAPPSLGSGSTARLRGRMARFSPSAEHGSKRDRVDRLIGEIDLADVRDATTVHTTRFLDRCELEVDVVVLAATVPTSALAAAMGWPNSASEALVADVHALAAAVGRGEPATVATDAAVDRLLARATDHGGDVDAAVSLLYQNADATRALLLSTAAAEVGGHAREPAVRQTVRVAAADVTLGDAGVDHLVDITAGTVVQLDLVVGDREFGYGPHACPGRAMAEVIVDAAMDVLRDRTGLSPARIDRDADDSVVGFRIG